jgi:HAD superfamily hydrolase (TIGR01509 family)
LKVRAVVFDLGKVLVDFDYGIAARALARQSTAPPESIRLLIDQSPLLIQYESAGISSAQFFETVQSEIGFTGSFDEFANAFADIFTEIPAMTEFQAELHARSLATCVLSNTNELAVQHVRRRFPFFSRFSDYVLSFEHGVMKPADRIYEIVEERMGVSRDQVLFIDDRPENVAGGERRAWRTICHRSPEETIALARSYVS